MFAKSAALPNGTRVHDPVQDKLWLLINGKCHHVTSNEVFSLLFKPRVFIQDVDNLNGFRFGEPLIFGTCLVRASSFDFPDFLAIYSSKVMLHKIGTAQVAERYGLDFHLARTMPAEILKGIPKGRPLE